MKNKILYLLIFSFFNSCKAPEIPVVCAFSLTKIEQCFHRNSLLVNFSQFVLKHSLEFSQPALYHPALIFIYFTLYCTVLFKNSCSSLLKLSNNNKLKFRGFVFFSQILINRIFTYRFQSIFKIKRLELLFRHRFYVFTGILKIESQCFKYLPPHRKNFTCLFLLKLVSDLSF